MTGLLTDYFLVQQHDGICKDSKILVLFLSALWVPPVIFSLTLGSSVARRSLAFLGERNTRFPTFGHQVTLSLIGSSALHMFAWNLAVAALLRRDDDEPSGSLKQLYWTWYIRPMPATLVLFLSGMSPPLFLENAIEMQMVEGLIGLPIIGIYSWLLQTTTAEASENFPSHHQRQAWHQIRTSSEIGIAFWAISFLILCLLLAALFVSIIDVEALVPRALTHDAIWPSAIIRIIRQQDLTLENVVPAFFWLSVVLNFARTGVGIGIWTGLGQFDSSIFCPSLKTTGTIAAVTIALSFVDHVYRAMFSVGRVRWMKLDGIWELPLRAQENFPLDIVDCKLQGKTSALDAPLSMREIVELDNQLDRVLRKQRFKDGEFDYLLGGLVGTLRQCFVSRPTTDTVVST